LDIPEYALLAHGKCQLEGYSRVEFNACTQ
jgi:hypothetical protein